MPNTDSELPTSMPLSCQPSAIKQNLLELPYDEPRSDLNAESMRRKAGVTVNFGFFNAAEEVDPIEDMNDVNNMHLSLRQSHQVQPQRTQAHFLPPLGHT